MIMPNRDNPVADVFGSGAVRLGASVICDGFVDGYAYRVQTHIHEDHMADFNVSKGRQDILLSPATRDLLIAEHNADLEWRSNLIQVAPGKTYALDDGAKLSMPSSNHMLGACQVAVELPGGLRVGYSGDFGWPIGEVIQVDELVVDSTYGGPNSRRGYTQAEAETCLLETVATRLRHGPVHLWAHPGTVERAIQVIAGNVDAPLLASGRLLRAVRVYRQYGLAAGAMESVDSEAGVAAIAGGRYVRFYSRGDGFDNEPKPGSSVKCSAYMHHTINHPLLELSEKSYSIALSNHADFDETLAYIRATGARKVVTDNTRTHGVDLAIAINAYLDGVYAEPSSNTPVPRRR